MNMGIILKEMKQGYTDLLLHKTNKEIICAMPVDFYRVSQEELKILIQ